ncbi:ROK family protein [Alphaproteobacteria bacterium LSUCC0684]
MSVVAVDVGGTNVRFGFAEAERAPLSHIRNLACADFPGIEDAIDAYLGSLPDTQSRRIRAVSIAVAAPVLEDVINVTNNHWQFSKTALLNHLPVKSLLVINDFTAQALAQADPETCGNELVLDGASHPDAPLLVIGPGTGLGVAALISVDQECFVVEGEGGHVHFTPRDDLESELEAFLRQTSPYVSAENVISGPGLEVIYRFLCHLDGIDAAGWTAADIGKAALHENGLARKAVLILLNALATVMVNAILTMGCWRGAVIAGGIVPRLASLIPESRFEERFRHAGIMQNIFEHIPVWLATDTMAGLYGAKNALTNPNLASRRLAKT